MAYRLAGAKPLSEPRFKIQDSKAFIRQCTDIKHTNQRNNVKTNQIFLDEFMSGDPR